jgi:hypothetical protein
MSPHYSTTVRLDRLNLPSSNNNDDDSVVSTASSISDSDLEDNETPKNEKASAPVAVTKSADIEANAKPACPSTVNHIINVLSAVGTFGGLALITTGGMGTTLNKPIDNNIANVAMVLGGGALLLGSLIGNVIYTNNQAA